LTVSCIKLYSPHTGMSHLKKIPSATHDYSSGSAHSQMRGFQSAGFHGGHYVRMAFI